MFLCRVLTLKLCTIDRLAVVLYINILRILIDPENFIEANRLLTPTHIQPEYKSLFL